MRDFSRPALLIALVLLFVFLTNGSGFMLGFGLGGSIRWLLIGVALYFCFSCASGGCCRGRCEVEVSDDEEAESDD